MWAQTVTLHQVSSMFSKFFVWNTAENSLPRSETLSASKTADNFFFLQNNQVRGVLPLKSLRAHPASQNHFGESAGCWALIIVLLQPVELSVRCICQTWHGSIFMNPAALHRSQSGAPCPVHCGFAKLSFGMFVARIHCWHRHAEFQKWNTLPRVFKCGTFFLFEFFKNVFGITISHKITICSEYQHGAIEEMRVELQCGCFKCLIQLSVTVSHAEMIAENLGTQWLPL